MLASKLLSACGGSETLYVDDVFSTWLYTGNGSTQTITNGIDLAGKGGLVWVKGRSAAYSNSLVDTVRGVHNYLQSNSSAAQNTSSATLTAFSSNGFSVGNDGWYNNPGQAYASWTFRKAPKFFDCGTYTGNATNRTISHSLGIKPGLIITKATSGVSGWAVYHQSLTATQRLRLDSTSAATTSGSPWGNTEPTATQFTVNNDGDTNAAGVSYVWYAFAHDTSAEGIIQCGSFTTDGSGNATVNLGWEPQFLQAKASSTTGAWFMFDQMRGWNMSTDENLLANSANAAITGAEYGNPTATGFYVTNYAASATYIYVAIRRPNKPPTSGTQVYSGVSQSTTGNSVVTTGFPVDLTLMRPSDGTTTCRVFDRLRGAANALITSTTAAEVQPGGYANDSSTGIVETLFTDGFQAIYWNFRRAPGVFDVVAYTGTGSARTVNHSLGAVPELMIVKVRSGTTGNWAVYASPVGATKFMRLDTTDSPVTDSTAWNNTVPTSSVFSVGTLWETNRNTSTYIAYLFASSPGIQYINSYVGDGTTGRVINCGFTAGARFVCIKATSTTGDWLIADTARGLVAGNDPRLSLNSTASEVTSEDWLDPHSSGFIVNQVSGSNANVNGVTYLVWAIA